MSNKKKKENVSSAVTPATNGKEINLEARAQFMLALGLFVATGLKDNAITGVEFDAIHKCITKLNYK